MELNINHGVPSLRVDFVPCPPPAIPGLIERLPFHHLNASFFHLLLRLSVFYPVLFLILKGKQSICVQHLCSLQMAGTANLFAVTGQRHTKLTVAQ